MTIITSNMQSSEMTNNEVDIIPDLVFAVELLADLYGPKNRPTPLPVIIWLHGGGWRFGDRKLGPDFSTKRMQMMMTKTSKPSHLKGWNKGEQ